MATSTQASAWDGPKVYKHHEQRPVCHTRPKYRDGRRPKAVKVYTINLESRYLLVQGVPAIGVMQELVQLLALYGAIEEYRVLDEYPAEEFTEVYLFKFQKLTSARAAKRKEDEKSFFGGLLHVCYAPEYETVEDTRQKLQDRRRYVNRVALSKQKESDLKTEGSEPLASTPGRADSSGRCEEERRPQNVTKDSHHASTANSYQGFPLLPLPLPPPLEKPFCQPPYSGHLLQGRPLLPTEDKMGSLHHYIDTSKDPKPHTATTTSAATTTTIQQSRPPTTNSRPTKGPSSHERFLPRTAHLDQRKRKAEETVSRSLMGSSDEPELFIGPKLPEIPKTDLEDASLNITANIIRNTMSKIASVPELQPPEKKVVTAKPRRRI
ncbi:RNA-binding protein 48-like [Engraulis encrasicolus]|uniref:RNA-binding protein 48-like n=1 Tax=Engraulis encrasicolus TaxID=184585 RepID=UPI002FD5BB17